MIGSYRTTQNKNRSGTYIKVFSKQITPVLFIDNGDGLVRVKGVTFYDKGDNVVLMQGYRYKAVTI